MTQQLHTAAAPCLLISCDVASRNVNASDAPVLIGRDPSADLRINHPMISRTHVQVQADDKGKWTLADHGSRNGIFIDGVRRDSAVVENGMAIRLGDPTDGIEVRFSFPISADGEPDDATDNIAHTSRDVAGDRRDPDDDGATDPSIKAAGAAVRARREELDITQRGWASASIINASALIAFEKGRSWPRTSTQERLEEELHWPRGTISQIRANYWAAADPEGVTTTLTDTSGEPVLIQAIATGVKTIESAINDLPAPHDPQFNHRATALTANLGQLEALAAKAALDPQATPTTALTLTKIRRLTSQLIELVAQSPSATLGQRLHAARRRAALSTAETAAAAKVSTATIEAIEAGDTASAETASKVAALIALLDQS